MAKTARTTDREPVATTREPLPFELKPIRRISVFRSIIDQLDQLIETLEPGDRLGSERELSEQLGVSRVSVREALRALESMGRIEIRRNSGSYVSEDAGTHQHLVRLKGILSASGAESINDLIEVREGIEVKVVELVAARPESDLTDVHEFLAAAEEEAERTAEDPGSIDTRFEALLGRHTGNPLLAHFQRLVHELWVSTWLELGGAVEGRQRLHQQHVAILDALEAGDGSRAAGLMSEHVHPRTPAGGAR